MIERLVYDDPLWTDPITGISFPSKHSFIEGQYLDLCGCGNPGEIREYIREGLENIDNQNFPAYEDLPAMFLVNWANGKEYAEHGTTVRCSWLTDLGKELLNDLNILSNMKEEDPDL